MRTGAWLLAVIGLAAVACAGPSSAAQEAGPPTLTVTGEGRVDAEPDTAEVWVGVEHQAGSAERAQEQVNEIMAKVIRDVERLDLANAQTSTSGLSISAVYENSRDRSGPPRVVGYRASNRLAVSTSAIDRIGEVIDTALEAGAGSVQGVSFRLEDRSEAVTRALRGAVRDATMKARAIAGAMGETLGPVRSVREGSTDVPTPFMPMGGRGAVMAMESSTGDAVRPGMIDVRASVTVTYELRSGGGGDGAP